MSTQDKDGFVRVTRRGKGNRRQGQETKVQMQPMRLVEPLLEKKVALCMNECHLQALNDSLTNMVAHFVTVREEKCVIPKEDVLR